MTIRADRTHKPGTVCAEVGCTTILSRFNPQRYCSICARKHPPGEVGSYAGTIGRRKTEPTFSIDAPSTTEPEYASCKQCGTVITKKLADQTDGHCRPCNARPMTIDHDAIEAFLSRRPRQCG